MKVRFYDLISFDVVIQLLLCFFIVCLFICLFVCLFELFVCYTLGLELSPEKRSVLYAEQLTSLLGRQLMSEKEVQDAIQYAVVLQAGQESTPGAISTNLASSGGDVDVNGSLKTGQSPVPINLLDRESTSMETMEPHRLSLWALEAGICHVLCYPIPLIATVAQRSIDKLTASISDKHERGLLSNLISPKDIGISYDMIGGLDEAKEMLRQCITYPLKYPHLYQASINEVYCWIGNVHSTRSL